MRLLKKLGFRVVGYSRSLRDKNNAEAAGNHRDHAIHRHLAYKG